MSLKKTPLHIKHMELKARMAEFAGYDMPISYDEKTGGMLKERLAVRQHMGMFDVSHMGEFWVKGPEATAFLSFACTRPFSKLPDCRAQYCLLLNDQGFVLDDIIVYRFNEEKYWVVVNASNVEKDFAHLQKLSKSFKVSLEDVSQETALIALQGPNAEKLMTKLFPGSEKLRYYSFMMSDQNWLIARTGYTGEDGIEVFLPSAMAMELWTSLEAHDVVPIGLGARDTLRLEVGFPLYGHELTDNLRPMETFSAFATDLLSEFMGVSEARKSPRYLPIAVETASPKPLRADEKLFISSKEVGRITSGSISPLRRIGIGLGLVDLKEIQEPLKKDAIFLLESAGKPREAVRTEPPFVETPRVKKRTRTVK